MTTTETTAKARIIDSAGAHALVDGGAKVIDEACGRRCGVRTYVVKVDGCHYVFTLHHDGSGMTWLDPLNRVVVLSPVVLVTRKMWIHPDEATPEELAEADRAAKVAKHP